MTVKRGDQWDEISAYETHYS